MPEVPFKTPEDLAREYQARQTGAAPMPAVTPEAYQAHLDQFLARADTSQPRVESPEFAALMARLIPPQNTAPVGRMLTKLTDY